MAKTKRRRPSQRSKRRPPSQQAPPRIGMPYEPAPTRTFVAPSREARRARMIRAGIAGGAAIGFIIGILIFVGGGGGGELRTTTLSGKVLAPTVKSRATETAEPIEFATGDRLSEGNVIETDATGLGEFEYADGSIVRVGPSSVYTLTKSRSEGKRRDIVGTLTTGRSWHRVTPRSGGDAQYASGVTGATAVVKGTSFATVCPTETNCFYTVIKGKVHVTDAVRQEADLAANDQVEVKFGRIEPVKHLTSEEIGADPWLAQNITLDGGTPPDPGETTTTLAGETTTTMTGETTTTVAGQTGTTSRTGTATTRSSGGGGSPPPPPPPPPPGSPPPPPPPPPPATTTPPTSPPTTRRCDRVPKPQGCNPNPPTTKPPATTTPPTTAAP